MVESEEFQGKQFLMISSDRRPSRAAGTGNSKQGQGRAGQARGRKAREGRQSVSLRRMD